MLFCWRNTIAVATMAFAMTISQTDAVVYDRVGDGLCRGESGEEYSHILIGNIDRYPSCSAACDGVNGGDEDISKYYRGFSYVKNDLDRGLRRGDCMCLYDCHHLPPLSITSEDDLWTRHDPEKCAEGRINMADGLSDVGCFEIVVANHVSKV